MEITIYSVLFYDVVDDYVARRAAFRDAHIALAQEFRSRGELVMGGAVGDPPRRAMLVFRAERSVVEGFVARDPYARNGLVTRWEIQPWAVPTLPA